MISVYGKTPEEKALNIFRDFLNGYIYRYKKVRIFSELIRYRWHSCFRKCRIHGRVTDADGTTPLKGIWVYVPYYKYEFGSYTDEDGNYNIRGLKPGVYNVRFHDKSGKYIHYSIEAIKLSNRKKAASIYASLSVAGHIKGRITEADGTTPLQGIFVSITMRDGSRWLYGGNSIRLGGYNIRSGETKTDEKGNYDIGNLMSGIYRICLGDTYWNGKYSFQYYRNKLSVERGDDIIVHAGETITGINASLTLNGNMKVLVKDPDGMTPLKNMEFAVFLYLWDSMEWIYYESFFYLSTDKDSICDIPIGLTPGTYWVSFYSSSKDYFSHEPLSDNLSEGIIITSGENVICSKSLFRTSSIKGTVRDSDSNIPLQNITVTKLCWTGSKWIESISRKTDSEGSYCIDGIYAVTRRIKFSDEYGQYVTQYYKNQPSVELADDIHLISGQTISGIDAFLKRDRSMRFRIN